LSIALRPIWHRPAVVATLLLAGSFAIGSAAAAGKIIAPSAKIVALDFDVDNNALFKAYSRTLYLSRTEGRDWEAIALPNVINRGHITSISIPAKSRGVLYVAGPGFGVLRSEDDGRRWNAINSGLPSNDVVALSSHADQPETLYVLVARRGIFRSEDAGSHWRLMDTGPRAKVVQFVHSNMPGSMQTGWLFAATARGVSRSMDCFCGWRDAGALGRPVTAVAYQRAHPKEVYAAAKDALFFSADGGEHWSPLPSPGHNVSALVATPAGTLYAAVSSGGLFRSADAGMTWHRVDE